MLIETLVADCKLDHSGSFVRGVPRLIEIDHAEWNSGEGIRRNAPCSESMKLGDSQRPCDGQRINDSQRMGSREEERVRTEVGEYVQEKHTGLSISGLNHKDRLALKRVER